MSRTFRESVEAYACFMFDNRQLNDSRIEVDESNLDSVGEVCWKFLGVIGVGLDIFIKFDAEANICELVFETDKRQFCALVNKQKFIGQDELEWNRLASYWIGLATNSKILKQAFNESLISTGLPECSIEWDLTQTKSAIRCGSNKSSSKQIFESFLPQICEAFSFEFKLNLFNPSDWRFRYLSTSKYGYCLQCQDVEIQLFVNLDRLRLSILLKNFEKMWLDLPPESLRLMDENLQCAIFDSLFLAVSD